MNCSIIVIIITTTTIATTVSCTKWMCKNKDNAAVIYRHFPHLGQVVYDVGV